MKSIEGRDLAPDALRGFALLGILIVNIPFLALLSAEGARGIWLEGLANGTAAGLMIALFAGKFYILFAFLFGYSASYIIKGDSSTDSSVCFSSHSYSEPTERSRFGPE